MKAQAAKALERKLITLPRSSLSLRLSFKYAYKVYVYAQIRYQVSGIRYQVSGNLIIPGEAFSPKDYYSRHPEQVIHIYKDKIKVRVHAVIQTDGK